MMARERFGESEALECRVRIGAAYQGSANDKIAGAVRERRRGIAGSYLVVGCRARLSDTRRDDDAMADSPRQTRKMWTLCLLLFGATTLNYLDRQTISILAPTIQKELGLNNEALGWLFSVFYY